MKPRRLHKLTIFSMRWASVGTLILVAGYTDHKRCRGVCAKRLSPWRLTQPPLQQKRRLRLWLDCHLGLHRVGDETLLVRAMIHLLDLLRRGLFFAGEFQPLSECDACDGESSFGIFFHVAGGVINVFVEHEPLFARDGE